MDEEARLTQALVDLLDRSAVTGSRDYYPKGPSGAIYRVSVELWQDAPQRQEIGTLTAWKKE